MKAQFMDLLTLQGMKGVFLLSKDGKVLFKHAKAQETKALDEFDWSEIANALGERIDLDILFDKVRVYLKRDAAYILVAILGMNTPIALTRMNSDIVLAELKNQARKGKKGFGKFFGS